MDVRNIIVLIFVSLLLFCTVCAQKNVDDFNIDESYNNAYNGTSNSLYLNEKQDSGIIIYKYVTDDVDDDDDAYDDLIHDDGRDYLTNDDDLKVDIGSDNIVNFTDYDHAQHGVAEVINCGGEDYVIVFWTKDTSNVDNNDLISQLNEFNKDNDVKAIAF